MVSLPGSWRGWVASIFGLGMLSLGGAFFMACVRRFALEGRGTLAPWDPPTHLVVEGPYAYVRNPMISGVILLLMGEALLLRSIPHLEWAGIFFLLNAIYIPLVEEPGLRARFGKAYEEYAGGVPRLVPRLTPWRPV
jgi:protein-S-isoprenylcysteine O-methyltransferase Ste14